MIPIHLSDEVDSQNSIITLHTEYYQVIYCENKSRAVTGDDVTKQVTGPKGASSGC